MNALNSDSRVVIYGAGKIGRRIFDLCEDRGIEVAQVWDNFPDKVFEFHRKDLISVPPDFSGADDAAKYDLDGATVVVTAFSPNMSEMMARPLEGKGFGKIIYDRTEISSILIEHCEWLDARDRFELNLHDCSICPARRDEKVECDLFNGGVGMSVSDALDVPNNGAAAASSNGAAAGSSNGAAAYLSFPVIGFLVTTRCNLTCVGCNHLQDHFQKSDEYHFDADEILGDLRKLVKAVDFVKSVVIVGGEALTHPKFEYMLSEVIKLPKVGLVTIITNGTVVPKKDSVYELLANPRVTVEISGYGDELSDLQISNRTKFFEKLDDAKAAYRYDEATQWIDFGGFEKRNWGSEKAAQVYNTCCFVSNDLLNGKLHKCSRSAYGQLLGKIPAYEDDYVDIRATNEQDLRGELEKFVGMIPMACDHCDGTTTNTIPAGVQVVNLKIVRNVKLPKTSTV